jgi:hypothetical protein
VNAEDERTVERFRVTVEQIAMEIDGVDAESVRAMYVATLANSFETLRERDQLLIVARAAVARLLLVRPEDPVAARLREELSSWEGHTPQPEGVLVRERE